MISVFKNITDTSNAFTQSTRSILDRFKTDDRFNIASMASMDKAQYTQAKRSLPVVCFGGMFSTRSKAGLEKSSGLLVLDFDGINPDEYKKLLASDPYCYSVFNSPSGKGVKALMLIKEVANDDEYKKYFAHFKAKYKDIDDSGKDISRACFFCYDPNLYINNEVQRLVIADKPKAVDRPQQQIDPVKNDYATLSRICSIIRNSQEGQRHTKILAAARLAGGYVASKALTYSEAERILLQEADAKNEDWKDNKQAVKDGLENGMKSPLSPEKLKKEIEVEEQLLKLGKIYYTVTDKRKEIFNLYENGQQRGYDIGFSEVDDRYTCKLGATTYLYAAPFMGKTQWWFWYCIHLSKKHGLRHAIYSPETGKTEEIFADLAQTVARQDFYNTFTKQMDRRSLDDALEFIDKYFIIIDPDDGVLSVKSFYAYVDEIERVYNVKVHTATADPFNEFEKDLREFGGREDIYLERVLTEVRQNARINDRHNCIITHVQAQQILNEGGIRYYPMPTYREIAGGQAWSRKGMSMIAGWRPKEGLCDENGEPYPSNSTILEVQKSKPKGTGSLGRMNLLYNVNTHNYTDFNGNEPDSVQVTPPPPKYVDYELPEKDCPF